MPETIREMDLQAYVDGQLDPQARAEVEGLLARDPEAAARVMGDLHLMNSLRAALAPAGTHDSRATQQLARRFARARRFDRWWGRGFAVLPVVLTALLLGGAAFWGVRPLTASSLPPPYVAAAIAAHETSKLRLDMRSQPEVSEVDPEELRAATGILLPQYPASWQLRDVQVFPSPDGPGIEMVFDTPEAGLLTAFAVRPGDFALEPPISEPWGHGALVWMRLGETAHVLVIERGEAEQLSGLADALYDDLR